MKLTGTNRPITYTTHPSRERIQKTFTPGKGTKKQDCLRPLCGSQPTNPLLENQKHNKITTPQLHHKCRKHVVTTNFPPPHPRGRTVRSKGYGGHSVGETPGPIPNPEAKTHSADGTAPGRVWESRSPPEHHYTVESPNHTVGALPHLTPKHHRGTPGPPAPNRAPLTAGTSCRWTQATSSRREPASHRSVEGSLAANPPAASADGRRLGQRPAEQDDAAGSVLPDLRERWARRYPI